MSSYTVKELRAIAKDLGMTGYSKLNKIDLINAIGQLQETIAKVEVAIKDARTVEVETVKAEAVLADHADSEAQPFPVCPQVANEAAILDATPDGVTPPMHYPPTSRSDWHTFIHVYYWPVCAAIAVALYAGRVTARAWCSRPPHVNRLRTLRLPKQLYDWLSRQSARQMDWMLQ